MTMLSGAAGARCLHNVFIYSMNGRYMRRIYLLLLFILIATASVVGTIHAGYTVPGLLGAGAACAILIGVTIHTMYSAKIEDRILETGLVQQYLLSNFTVDQSTLSYLKKLLKEDYSLRVTTEQLLSAIEKEQTRREVELEKEELLDFKNKFFVGQSPPETLEQCIKQFVSIFGRGSMRNIYYLKKSLDEQKIPYTQEEGFTDKIVALENMIETEVIRRGGPPRREEKITLKTCPECGNEYPEGLLYCPFCEQGTARTSELVHDVVYCPQCHGPMVRSILKRDGKFVRGYQCRNLKCLYEVTYEESQNAQ